MSVNHSLKVKSVVMDSVFQRSCDGLAAKNERRISCQERATGAHYADCQTYCAKAKTRNKFIISVGSCWTPHSLPNGGPLLAGVVRRLFSCTSPTWCPLEPATPIGGSALEGPLERVLPRLCSRGPPWLRTFNKQKHSSTHVKSCCPWCSSTQGCL